MVWKKHLEVFIYRRTVRKSAWMHQCEDRCREKENTPAGQQLISWWLMDLLEEVSDKVVMLLLITDERGPVVPSPLLLFQCPHNNTHTPNPSGDIYHRRCLRCIVP